MTDREGHTYQIGFDPPANPELATGAEIIGTAFYHAFGYHTVDVYLTDLDPDRLVISDKATYRDPLAGGRKRPFTRSDVDKVLRRAARRADGKYRVLVSRFADGKPLGNLPVLRYSGPTIQRHRAARAPPRLRARVRRVAEPRRFPRRQQPGHAHRRAEPTVHQALHVRLWFDYGKWNGLRAASPAGQRGPSFEWKPGWLTLATLGIYARPWTRISYPDVPLAVSRWKPGDSSPRRGGLSIQIPRSRTCGLRTRSGQRASFHDSMTPPCGPSSRRPDTANHARPRT